MTESQWLGPVLMVLIVACMAVGRAYLDAKYPEDEE